MTVTLKKPAAGAIPVHLSTRETLAQHTQALPAAQQQWLNTVGFTAAPDTFALVPSDDGRLAAVWAGVRRADHPYALSALPRNLPEGRYALGNLGLALDPSAAALSWALGSYVFDAYKAPRRPAAELQLPISLAASEGLATAEAIMATRDLVNTPAEHLGPEALAATVKALAKSHGGKFKEIVGEDLIKRGFPAVHAVGRAAARPPRLIELTWGDPKHRKLTLVGKGVCFDSGGLDIKPAEGMRWMKKDMGGAANAIGLATLIMTLKLPVRLHLVVPAVENAISGNAFRPGDVFKTRQGMHIEIGNTDAEGRVILCDALAYACESRPELIIDLATLTGAARVALGPQLPALFSRHKPLANALVEAGMAVEDPLWELPLWMPYHASIESDIADIVNTGKGPMAGAITAALFLADFVPDNQEWAHIDLFAWNDSARPGRPVGGEAQTLRALWAYLSERFG